MNVSDGPAASGHTEDRIKILFVDDEENILRALERLFLDEDYEILTATSGEEGLKILERETADIVISDNRMPSMSGVDFMKNVCSRWPETIRIMLSGYADTAAILAAVNEGRIYKFVPKPWNDTDLKVAVADAVARLLRSGSAMGPILELRKNIEELTNLNLELKRLLKEETDFREVQTKELKRLHTIIDSLPMGILGVDCNKKVLLCNSRFASVDNDGKPQINRSIGQGLSEHVSRFVEKVRKGQKASKNLQMEGIRGKLLGYTVLSGISGASGDNENGNAAIFVFTPEDDLEDCQS